MPVHIEDVSSEVVVLDGDLPFSQAQLDKLVQLVIRRLEEKQRQAKWHRESTVVHNQATRPSVVER